MMINSGILHLKTDGFTPTHAEACELLLKAGNNRISFAVVENGSGTLKFLYDAVLTMPLESGLAELFARHQYLGFRFSKTKVLVETSDFSMLPAELYQEDQMHKLKNFIQTTRFSRFTKYHFPAQDMHIIANVAEAIPSAIEKYIHIDGVYCQAVPLLHYAEKSYPTGRVLQLQFNSGTFEVLLQEAGRLQLYNLFQVPGTDDFHYYLLNLSHEFRLQDKNTRVIVSGEIEKYSEIYRRLSRYFKVEFADSSLLFNYSDNFRLIPAHQFASLLSLALCE